MGPLLFIQAIGSLSGTGAQKSIKGVTWLFVGSPLAYFLKIIWVVMLVFAFACLSGIFSTSASQETTKALELAASKEGFLVLAVNLVAMLAIHTIHHLSASILKLELDRDVLKRQATNQGAIFQDMMDKDNKAAKPTESKSEESKPDKENENEV